MNPDALIHQFVIVANIAGFNVNVNDFVIEILQAGENHIPQRLQDGNMAVYVFLHGDVCLKVGKANSKSNARFQSQHYSPNSSGSNLAKSILGCVEFAHLQIGENNVKDWVINNTDRINIRVNADKGPRFLSLLEVFFQCKLNPKFEG